MKINGLGYLGSSSRTKLKRISQQQGVNIRVELKEVSGSIQLDNF
jgi:hypothetical protein